MKFYIHINYFENHYTLEQAFQHAARIGFAGIEVRDRDRSGATPLDDYLNLTAELAKRYGLELVYGCRVSTNAPDPVERDGSLRQFHQVLDQTAKHGHHTVNVFTGGLYQPGCTYSQTGSALGTEEDWAASIAALREAADRHPELTLALETHAGYLHDVAKPCLRLLTEVNRPNVTANFDYANIFLNRRGEPMEEAVQLLKGRIGYLHLKDVKVEENAPEGKFEAVPLGQGSIDLPRQLRLLAEAGYSGPICVENTMKVDKLPVAEHDFQALSALVR